jgi:hypothetical protein
VLHSLPPGYRFDLAKRTLLPRLTALGGGAAGKRRRPPRRVAGEEEVSR